MKIQKRSNQIFKPAITLLLVSFVGLLLLKILLLSYNQPINDIETANNVLNSSLCIDADTYENHNCQNASEFKLNYLRNILSDEELQLAIKEKLQTSGGCNPSDSIPDTLLCEKIKARIFGLGVTVSEVVRYYLFNFESATNSSATQ